MTDLNNFNDSNIKLFPEGHYQCNLCENTFPQPPYFMAYSYADPKIMDKIKFPPEYYEEKKKFEEAWSKIPEGSHPIKPKITNKDYEYMLNIQKNTNTYLLHIELCENCTDELETWTDEQHLKNKNR